MATTTTTSTPAVTTTGDTQNMAIYGIAAGALTFGGLHYFTKLSASKHGMLKVIGISLVVAAGAGYYGYSN